MSAQQGGGPPSTPVLAFDVQLSLALHVITLTVDVLTAAAQALLAAVCNRQQEQPTATCNVLDNYCHCYIVQDLA